MDFCSWCVGEKEASRLTSLGKTGGCCEIHKVEYLKNLKKLIEQRKVKRHGTD